MTGLRILLVDEDSGRAAALARVLAGEGYEMAALLPPDDLSPQRVQEIAPDILIVDLGSPGRDIIDHLRQITADQPRPIVMFVDQSDEETIRQAVQAGVSAYVIDGLNARRVKPVLDVAIARFREVQALREELKKTRETLDERKLIERAKGLLMRERKLSEGEAYAALRKLAMDRQQKLAEVAEALIAFADVLQRK